MLSLSTCPAGDAQGCFDSQQSSARKWGEVCPEGVLSFLSTGLGLSHTSKRGVKTAAEMKSKHLQVWEFPGRATKLPLLYPHSSAFTQPAVSLPRPAVTKSLILSVTIKTQIPLRRIADGDGGAKPGFTAVLHSQRGGGSGGGMLYHKFLNHKFLYHPLLHAGKMTPSATRHLTGWSRFQNAFSRCQSRVGFLCY